MSNPYHPEVVVQLTGEDGNAMVILGMVRKALRRAGVSRSEIEAFTSEATDGDYQHLLTVCQDWVSVR